MKLRTLAALFAMTALVACLGAGKFLRPSAEQKEAYLVAHPETPADVAQAIRDSKWILGMTEEQVLASLNNPYASSSHTTANVVYETWDYRNVISFKSLLLNFENGVLVSWSEI